MALLGGCKGPNFLRIVTGSINHAIGDGYFSIVAVEQSGAVHMCGLRQVYVADFTGCECMHAKKSLGIRTLR